MDPLSHSEMTRSNLPRVMKVAATQWHNVEDWTTPIGQSLAAKLASALAVLGSIMNSKLGLPAPELFQQSISIYRRLEKRVPGHFAGKLASCLAWEFQGSNQRGVILANCLSLIEEALFLKRRLCADNPLADNHRRDLSVYLLIYSRAVQLNPSFAGGANSRILSLLQEARGAASPSHRYRATLLDGNAAASEQFDHTLRAMGLKQAARRGLLPLQWQSSGLDIQVSVSLEYAKQLSSNSQYGYARRCLEETLPLARQLKMKRRDKFSDTMFYYLISLSTASYLSGDHEAGQVFYAEANDILRTCSIRNFYQSVDGIQAYGNQLTQNGLRDAACRAYADAAHLCLRRYNGRNCKFAYLQPISTAVHGYAAFLELEDPSEQARAVLEELVDLMRTQYTREPAVHWALLNRALSTLASSLVKRGQFHDAKRIFEELLSVTRGVVLAARDGGDRAMKCTMLAEWLVRFGNVLCHIGDFVSARDAYQEALELTRQRIRDAGSAGLVDLLAQFEEEYRRSMELQRTSVGDQVVGGVAGTGSSADDGTNTLVDDWDF